MPNLLRKLRNLISLRVISNTPEPETPLNEASVNGQRKVTFRVSAFMAKNLEEIVSQSNLSISIFVKTALYNHISFYKELKLEPFQLKHWLDDTKSDLTFGRYTITLDDTLSNELNRLESVYSANNLRFNKSHFIRCAVVDRLHYILSEE